MHIAPLHCGSVMRRLRLPWINKRATYFIVMVLAGACAHAQSSPAACGPLENAFGPYDYRPEKFRSVPGDPMPFAAKRNLVDGAHFTTEVENLIRGKGGPIGGDIDYTLRAWPNHHRALLSMKRYGERLKVDQVPYAKYSVECYFVRAISFARDDLIVRMLYAGFLNERKRKIEAMSQLEVVKRNVGDNPFTAYNLGLMYADLGAYDEALEAAHLAIAFGFPRMDLKERLVKAGKWSDPARSPE